MKYVTHVLDARTKEYKEFVTISEADLKQAEEFTELIKNICIEITDCLNCPFVLNKESGIPLCKFGEIPEHW